MLYGYYFKGLWQRKLFCYSSGMGQKRGQWEQLSSKTVHKNSFYSVREDAVIKPDGSRGTYHVIVGPGAAFTVAIDDDMQVYLVGMHKYTIDEYSIEIPGGGVGSDEPLAAAKRELQEETGLQATTWKSLGTTHPANGAMAEGHYIFLATGLSASGQDARKEEGITELMKVSFKEAFAMIAEGKITDEESITALTLAALELRLIEI
jgi:8-oxo-dGTP pyrophosphatase MutT (NUDIX family)